MPAETDPTENESTTIVQTLCEKYTAYEDALNALINALKKGRRLANNRSSSGFMGVMTKKLTRGKEGKNILDFCSDEKFKTSKKNYQNLYSEVTNKYDQLKEFVTNKQNYDQLEAAVNLQQESKQNRNIFQRMMRSISTAEMLRKASKAWTETKDATDEQKDVARQAARRVLDTTPDTEASGSATSNRFSFLKKKGNVNSSQSQDSGDGDGSTSSRSKLSSLTDRLGFGKSSRNQQASRQGGGRRTRHRTPTRLRHSRKTAPRTRRR